MKLEQKYGIPTFETCKKLSKYWKEETLFSWFQFKKNSSVTIDFYRNKSYYVGNINNNILFAPQVHELISTLPKHISLGNNDIESFHYFITDDLVAYENGYGDMFIGYSITDERPLAECLALLFLELKEKNIL